MGSFEFYDRPEVTPFILDYEGQSFEFLPENSVVYQFRNRPDVNHVLYDTDAASHLFFNYDLTEWMVGEIKDGDRRTFDERYGWLPKVVIEDYPTDEDINIFLDMNKAPNCLPEA